MDPRLSSLPSLLGLALFLPACTGYLIEPPPCRPPDADATDAADGGDDEGIDGDLERPEPPLGVVCLFVDEELAEQRREAGENAFAPYLVEILDHAGVLSRRLSRADLLSLAGCPVLVLAQDSSLDEAEEGSLVSFVNSGGTLIALAGTSGLDELLGLGEVRPNAEGYIAIDDSAPLTPPPLPLHVFGGVGATVTTARPVARLLDTAGEDSALAAITTRPVGGGEAWLVGPDLLSSIVTIQQGRPVTTDGEPAPDGSAALDDGILKADDGVVLDWELDRSLVAGEPLFLEPVADDLREVLLQLVLRAMVRRGSTTLVLWYWPAGLDAVGVLSHDSDGNVAAEAWGLLAQLEALELASTWCLMRYPETYPAELLTAIPAAGGEVALHYDAQTPDNPATTWSEENFQEQLSWLRALSGAPVATNKNHYTRWEGWVEFYRWCEAEGIEADQSKGPSKRGDVGFLYGSAHPAFPVDDAEHDNRLLDVLSIDLLAQDLVHTCPYEFGPALLDRAAEHFGVAHFLFHPAHTDLPEVAEALASIVEYGRAAGLEWWTVEQVNRWERQRRTVAITPLGEGRFSLGAPTVMGGVTLLVVPPPSDGEALVLEGRDLEWEPFRVYGVDSARLTIELGPGPSSLAIVSR